MKNRTIIMLALLMLATIGSTGPCGGKSYPVSDMAKLAVETRGVPFTRSLAQRAPCGLVHLGHITVSDAQLAAMCSGVANRQDAAWADGFKPDARKDGDFFEVFTPPVPCVLSPIQQIPSFMVNGGRAYDGTEWDQYNPKGPLVKDGRSAVFAAEYILSLGTPNSIWNGVPYHKGAMFACPDLSHVTEAVGNGFDHIFLANYPYTEQWRHAPPFDGWTWFSGSIIHGPSHPLLPRAGRVAEGLVGLTPPPASVITTSPMPDAAKSKAKEAGVFATVEFIESSNAIIRPVK